VAALFENKIASQQQLDEAARVLETAKNRRQSLEAALRSAEAEVTQAKARVAASQAALDRAQENLKYSTICSPIDGVVLSRNTEIGDAVSSILNLGSAATLIMTLGDMSSVYVKGKVDEADVGKIRVGLPVRTSIESYPGESFAGSVTRIAPMGWEQNNVTTFEVRVSISNPERRLRVNMSANAEVVLEERKNTLLIPEAALLYDKDNKPSVQRLAASANPGFTRIPVKTGISNGRQTEILEGLSQGERLVLP
jgi:HlyD family secretion protein